jgi:hypothetical protein
MLPPSGVQFPPVRLRSWLRTSKRSPSARLPATGSPSASSSGAHRLTFVGPAPPGWMRTPPTTLPRRPTSGHTGRCLRSRGGPPRGPGSSVSRGTSASRSSAPGVGGYAATGRPHCRKRKVTLRARWTSGSASGGWTPTVGTLSSSPSCWGSATTRPLPSVVARRAPSGPGCSARATTCGGCWTAAPSVARPDRRSGVLGRCRAVSRAGGDPPQRCYLNDEPPSALRAEPWRVELAGRTGGVVHLVEWTAAPLAVGRRQSALLSCAIGIRSSSSRTRSSVGDRPSVVR